MFCSNNANNTQVGNFDLYYNKLQHDQPTIFANIETSFNTVKQDTLQSAFLEAMNANAAVQAEQITDAQGVKHNVWQNIPPHKQIQFFMQMIYQDPASAQYPRWVGQRVDYIPDLKDAVLLDMKRFMEETFKDDISREMQAAQNATPPLSEADMWNKIKILIIAKMNDAAVKTLLKQKLLSLIGTKISQNITGNQTNILNDMNTFATT